MVVNATLKIALCNLNLTLSDVGVRVCVCVCAGGACACFTNVCIWEVFLLKLPIFLTSLKFELFAFLPFKDHVYFAVIRFIGMPL